MYCVYIYDWVWRNMYCVYIYDWVMIGWSGVCMKGYSSVDPLPFPIQPVSWWDHQGSRLEDGCSDQWVANPKVGWEMWMWDVNVVVIVECNCYCWVCPEVRASLGVVTFLWLWITVGVGGVSCVCRVFVEWFHLGIVSDVSECSSVRQFTYSSVFVLLHSLRTP